MSTEPVKVLKQVQPDKGLRATDPDATCRA